MDSRRTYSLKVGSVRRGAHGQPILTVLMEDEGPHNLYADVWMQNMARRYGHVKALIFIGAKKIVDGRESWYDRRVYQEGRLIWRNGQVL